MSANQDDRNVAELLATVRAALANFEAAVARGEVGSDVPDCLCGFCSGLRLLRDLLPEFDAPELPPEAELPPERRERLARIRAQLEEIKTVERARARADLADVGKFTR